MKQCPQCYSQHDNRGVFCSRACSNRNTIENLPEFLCKIPSCGIKFKPKSRSAKYCQDKHEKNCSVCGDSFLIRSRDWDKKELCNKCSRKNGAIKNKETVQKRYGVDNARQLESVKEKARETSLKKYGVDHFSKTEEYKRAVKESNIEKHGVEYTFQRPEVKEKIKKTFIEKYGGHPLKNEEVLEKLKATNLERYGVDNVAKDPEVFEKIKTTNMEKYGVPYVTMSESVKEKIKETWQLNYESGHPSRDPIFKEKMAKLFLDKLGSESPFHSEEVREKAKKTMLERYGVEYALQNEFFKNKQIKTTNSRINDGFINPSRISKVNRVFKETVESEFDCIIELEKKVGAFSFDCFIPELNILIDLNPTISHNSLFRFGCLKNNCSTPCEKHSPLSIDYHFKRSVAAREAGYKLIQFYDWDSQEKIIKFLRGRLEFGWKKLSAKKLELRSITQKEANVFLSECHIQGGAKGQSHCYGLFDEDVLLAVATFGKSRFGSKADFEWIRYSVKRGYIIHGASIRLFKAFAAELPQTLNSRSIISYIDYNHTTSSNTFLNTVGFKELSPTGPQLIWSKKDKKIYNNSLLRLGADKILGTDYGKPEACGFKNNDIMILEGWLPVYTAGNRVFSIDI